MPESALLESSKSFENLCHNIENGAPGMLMMGTQITGKFLFDETADARFAPQPGHSPPATRGPKPVVRKWAIIAVAGRPISHET